MVSVPVKGGMQVKTTLHTASCQSEMSVIKMSDNIRGCGEAMERDELLLIAEGRANYGDQSRGSSKN